MKQIINNPYRTLGLLVGATARQQERQLKRLKQYILTEQVPQDDFSFPILGALHRTEESVSEAASKLTLDKDRLNAALFWFYNGNAITDEPALEELKSGHINNSVVIWTKLTNGKEVDSKNSSAFQNLSNLAINASINEVKIKENLLEKGIKLKIKFLESDHLKDLKEKATDATFRITKKEVQLSFLMALQQEIEEHSEIATSKLHEILLKLSFTAKDDFFKSISQKLIERIEKTIEATKTKRKDNGAIAINAGDKLYKAVGNQINRLENILGGNDLKYISTSDKLSDEMLQCGIDYFLFYRDTDTDPSSESMALFLKAKVFAIGNIAKQRCQENIDNLQKWINEKPEREKQKKIFADYVELINLIDEYESRNETVANASQLLASAMHFLINVKAVLGSSDELYLALSTRIASEAQGMCVSEINKLQGLFADSYDRTPKLAVILLLKGRVNDAWKVTMTIGAMDLRADFRAIYNKNKNALSDLLTQLTEVDTGSKTSDNSGNCYIATMAYGDYYHPQVLELRKFRDEVLLKYEIGKLFVKVYYYISPKLVEILKNKNQINALIRTTLTQFNKVIKK